MSVRILIGDCRDGLRTLADESVSCCVTSPPYYGLRDYGAAGQIGLEASPEAYVVEMVAVFRAVRRVLRRDGTLWLNLGDSYAASGRGGNPADSLHQKQASNRGSRQFFQREAVEAGQIGRRWVKPPAGYKPKDLIGIPWLIAFALRADGWYLRQRLPWLKRNPMPESTRDRPTSAIEEVFLLTRSRDYFYDYDAVKRAMAPSSGPRLAQDIDAQAGSRRAHGGARTSGAMKAVSADKQRGHSRRHAGINARWDAMERSEQRASRAFRNTDLFFESLDAPHGAIGDESGMVALDVATHAFREAHFATFPPALIAPLIKAGCPQGGVVLDPFGGAGTTALVADRLGRDAVLIELNAGYAAMAERRLRAEAGLLADVRVERIPAREAAE